MTGRVGMQALDSTEEPIPAAVKAVLKAKVELLVRKVTAQQKAAAAAKQVLCPCWTVGGIECSGMFAMQWDIHVQASYAMALACSSCPAPG